MARKLDPDRLAAVEAALLRMESPSLLVRRLSREWACKPKTVHSLVHDVLQRWRQDEALLSIDDLRHRLMLMALDTYREARAQKNTRAALMCIAEVAKLAGITRDQATAAVSHVYTTTGAFTAPKMLAARLRELRAAETAKCEHDDEEDKGDN